MEHDTPWFGVLGFRFPDNYPIGSFATTQRYIGIEFKKIVTAIHNHAQLL